MTNLSISKLDDYRKMGGHILIPQSSIQQVGPLFKVALNMVYLSDVPEDRDVWKLPGGKLGLSKQGLYKISIASGIEMLDSRVISSTRDYVCFEASVRRRNESGAFIVSKATYEIDLTVVLEDLTATFTSRIGKNYGPRDAGEARQKALDETGKIRRYKLQRAETGAYLRAIRQILALKTEYTAEELSKPFITYSMNFDPDMNDPDMKRVVLDAARRAVEAQYSGVEYSAPAPISDGGFWDDINPDSADGLSESESNDLLETIPEVRVDLPTVKESLDPDKACAWLLKAKTGKDLEDRGAICLQKGFDIEMVSQWVKEWGDVHGLTASAVKGFVEDNQ